MMCENNHRTVGRECLFLFKPEKSLYKTNNYTTVKQVSIHFVKGYKCQIFNFCIQNIQNFVYTFVISIFLITIDNGTKSVNGTN